MMQWSIRVTAILLLCNCCYLDFHQKERSAIPEVMPMHRCFIKASQRQLDVTLHLSDSESMGTQLEFVSRPVPYMRVVGSGWPAFWKQNPAGLLLEGDSVFSVDDCSLDDVVKEDQNEANLSPFVQSGYISKFDLLLCGPPESIAANIRNVIVERRGKKFRLSVQGLRIGKLKIHATQIQ